MSRSHRVRRAARYAVFLGGVVTPPVSPGVTTISFDQATWTVGEAGGTVTRTLTVDRQGVTGALAVNLVHAGTATAGSDFTAPASVTIASGANSVAVPYAILDDANVEAAETIVTTATLAAYPSAIALTTGTITDNDTAGGSQFIAVVTGEGQSDMAGRGSYDSSIDTEMTGVMQFGCDPSNSATYRNIVNSIYPLYHAEGANAAQISPLQTYAKTLKAALGPNCVGVLIVPNAYGDTGLVAPGAEWKVGNSLHEAAIAQTNLAIAAAKALYPASYLHSRAWIQGNNDGATAQATYEAALSARFADARARVTGDSTAVPVVMGSMLPIAVETQSGKQTIEAATLNVAAAGTKIYYVPGPYGSVRSSEAPTYIHMGTAGVRAVGVNMANVAMGQRVVNFARSIASANEGNSGTTALAFPVYRSDAVGAATAPVAFVPGDTSTSDFPGGVYPSGLVATWSAGQNVATVNVTFNGDTDVEGTENFSLTLNAPSGYVVGPRSSVSGSIINDDAGGGAGTNLIGAGLPNNFAAWTITGGAVATDQAANPVGGANNADLFTEDTSGASHNLVGSSVPGATLTAGQTYTFAVDAKSNGRPNLQIFTPSSLGAASTTGWCDFSLADGAIGSRGSAVPATATDLGNGWWRCSVTWVPTVTGPASFAIAGCNNSNSSSRNQSYTGNGTNGFFLANAQIVAGSVPNAF